VPGAKTDFRDGHLRHDDVAESPDIPGRFASAEPTMSPLSQMWCLFETVGLHGRVATGFRDQCRSRCTGFWRSSSIPTGATAVFRCGRGRPSYWSPAGRENRSSPAGMADASSGGRYWARNDCSTDGCCSASGAAALAARSSALSSGRSLAVQQRVPSRRGEESGLRWAGVTAAQSGW